MFSNIKEFFTLWLKDLRRREQLDREDYEGAIKMVEQLKETLTNTLADLSIKTLSVDVRFEDVGDISVEICPRISVNVTR